MRGMEEEEEEEEEEEDRGGGGGEEEAGIIGHKSQKGEVKRKIKVTL